MKKRCWAVLLAGVVLLSAAGCGSGGGKSENTSAGYGYPEVAEEAAAADVEYESEVYDTAAQGSYDDGGSITSENGIESVKETSRKLIKTVRLEMQTKEFDAVIDGLSKKVQEMEGYIEGSSVWGSSYYSSGTRSADYTVRIPANRLDEFVEVVSGLGNVTYKNEGVEDVTLQYVDVESRKKALETEQTRLMELLERAENLEDLLTIESRLSEVRYELENYGSRLRLLDNQIDYSTVYINISEVERVTQTGERTFFEEIADRFNDSLYAVGMGLRGFVIGFVGSLPILAVWAVVIAVFVLIIRKVIYRESKGTRIWKKNHRPKEEQPTDSES